MPNADAGRAPLSDVSPLRFVWNWLSGSQTPPPKPDFRENHAPEVVLGGEDPEEVVKEAVKEVALSVSARSEEEDQKVDGVKDLLPKPDFKENHAPEVVLGGEDPEEAVKEAVKEVALSVSARVEALNKFASSLKARFEAKEDASDKECEAALPKIWFVVWGENGTAAAAYTVDGNVITPDFPGYHEAVEKYFNYLRTRPKDSYPISKEEVETMCQNIEGINDNYPRCMYEDSSPSTPSAMSLPSRIEYESIPEENWPRWKWREEADDDEKMDEEYEEEEEYYDEDEYYDEEQEILSREGTISSEEEESVTSEDEDSIHNGARGGIVAIFMKRQQEKRSQENRS